jgi:hypothetical protein
LAVVFLAAGLREAAFRLAAVFLAVGLVCSAMIYLLMVWYWVPCGTVTKKITPEN